MIWVVHKDRKIREFVANLLDSKEDTQEESKTFDEFFTGSSLGRLKDGDTVYGSLYMNEIFNLGCNCTYINIVMPKKNVSEKIWIGWVYEVRMHSEEEHGQASITLIDKETYEEMAA